MNSQMRTHYGDTGNAQDYYYEIANFDGEICIMLVPKKYFDSCGFVSDWHLRWMDTNFEQVMESQYVYCGLKNQQEVEQYLVEQGFTKKPSVSQKASAEIDIEPMSKNIIASCNILKKEELNREEQCVKNSQPISKGKKFESDELKDVIISMKDTCLQEIFYAYDQEMYFTNKKHWKRVFKKKVKVNSLVENLDEAGSQCHYNFENYYDEGFVTDGILFDEEYFSNKTNTVIAREFQFNEEDCQVLILTNDKDNKIVAIAHHID